MNELGFVSFYIYSEAVRLDLLVRLQKQSWSIKRSVHHD